MKFKALLVSCLIALLCGNVFGQTGTDTPPAQVVATKVEVRLDDISPAGELYAIIGGKEQKISDSVIKAWLVRNGKGIAYSTPGTRMDYEGEGQALYYYDVTTGKAEGLHVSSFAVEKVVGTNSTSGRFALLISLSDGAAQVPHFAVMEPRSGKINLWERSRLLEIKNSKLVVGMYARSGPAKMGPNDKPKYIRTFNLDTVLKK